MKSDEFKKRFGPLDPLFLHVFRNELWLAIIDHVMPQLNGEGRDGWPAARDLYAAARAMLDRADEIPGIRKKMAGIGAPR